MLLGERTSAAPPEKASCTRDVCEYSKSARGWTRRAIAPTHGTRGRWSNRTRPRQHLGPLSSCSTRRYHRNRCSPSCGRRVSRPPCFYSQNLGSAQSADRSDPPRSDASLLRRRRGQQVVRPVCRRQGSLITKGRSQRGGLAAELDSRRPRLAQGGRSRILRTEGTRGKKLFLGTYSCY